MSPRTDHWIRTRTDGQLRHALRALVGPDLAADVAPCARREELIAGITAVMQAEADALRGELARRGASLNGTEESCSSASRPALSPTPETLTAVPALDAAAAEAVALCRPLVCGGQGRSDYEAEEAGWLLLGGLIGMALTVAAWGAWAVLP